LSRKVKLVIFSVFLSVLVGLSLLFIMRWQNAVETSVIGLTIGKTTIEDLKHTYPQHSQDGISKYSNGAIYKIKPSTVPLDNVKEALVVFDTKGVALVVRITFYSKGEYNKLYDTLLKKYHLLSSQNPYVGDKITMFENGTVRILMYEDKKIRDLKDKVDKMEEEQKKDSYSKKL